MNRLITLILILLQSCLSPVIECADEQSALTGLNIASDTFPEIAHLLDKAHVICASLEDGARSCGFSKTPTKLEGCTPFSGNNPYSIQRGRIVVIEGSDICRVIIHESVHWTDMSMTHTDEAWPIELEMTAKSRCEE